MTESLKSYTANELAIALKEKLAVGDTKFLLESSARALLPILAHFIRERSEEREVPFPQLENI